MQFRLPLLCTLLLAFVAAAPARAEKNEFLLGLNSAMVEYQVTTTGRGANSTGTDTLWVAEQGRKSARLQKRFKSNGKVESESLGLLLDGWIYSIDLVKKTGMKMSLQQAQDMAKRFGKGAQGQDGQAFVKDFVEKNGGKILPAEEFLGRTCDVFEVWGMKTWAYKGVALKTEGTVMGIKTSMVATKFEENPSIPASRFEIPAGVKIEDMPDLSAMLGGMMAGRPPAGGAEGEEAPATQKPIKKPVTDGPAKPAPDAKPAPIAKPKPAPKADPNAVGLSLAEFREAIAKVHVKGYTTMAAESADGALKVNLLDTKGGALSITALPLAIFDALETHPNLKIDSKFDHEGHAAFAGVLNDPDDGPTGVVIVKYPERKLTLVIGSTPAKDKEVLENLLGQIAF
ncbi:MAG TPA: hypothetical protein VK178_08790 [Opitutaceae bacterium]|nr:hypothetical protein [Opitutaceae bacterium]